MKNTESLFPFRDRQPTPQQQANAIRRRMAIAKDEDREELPDPDGTNLLPVPAEFFVGGDAR